MLIAIWSTLLLISEVKHFKFSFSKVSFISFLEVPHSFCPSETISLRTLKYLYKSNKCIFYQHINRNVFLEFLWIIQLFRLFKTKLFSLFLACCFCNIVFLLYCIMCFKGFHLIFLWQLGYLKVFMSKKMELQPCSNEIFPYWTVFYDSYFD